MSARVQFEAILSADRLSSNPNDYALIAILALLALRIFEAVRADIDDVGDEHVYRVLRVIGKGGKVVLTPAPSAVARPSTTRHPTTSSPHTRLRHMNG